VIGWKEFEMEVVRDRNDNCIIICSIEERRPDGRAHGRLDHGRTGADADRQGIPGHARRVDRGAAQDRRRVRRLEHCSSRSAPGWPAARDQDEPARVALVGARVEGDRFPIAKIAAKLAVGYTLDELRNDITGARRLPRSSRPSTTS
jgi:carbamoyl-phosphate synthase large subunit